MARTPPARTAGQRPLIAVVALAVLALGAFDLMARSGEPDSAPGQTDVVGGQDAAPEPGRTAAVVGPPQGADVEAYIDDRTAALLEAPDDVDTAVVSFARRLRLQDALALVDGEAGADGEVRAVLLRLPLERATPRTVRVGPGEDPVAAVEAALAEQATVLREELASLEELLASGTVDDEAFEQEYERRIGELESALGAIEEGDVVHALVLRAPLAQLQALVDTTAVRLVDPAPPGTDAGLSTFFGLLPGDEETVSVGAPA